MNTKAKYKAFPSSPKVPSGSFAVDPHLSTTVETNSFLISIPIAYFLLVLELDENGIISYVFFCFQFISFNRRS